MLFNTSRGSIKKAFQFFSRLPFSKTILQKLTELARGKCIVNFTMHRVISDSAEDLCHPHLLNKTAITLKQAERLLVSLHRRLPFISVSDSIEFLKGTRTINQSHAVLFIEVPYSKTITLIRPLLEELKIPATVVLDTESLNDGKMPWMDEIVYRLGVTKRSELSVNFIDRSFALESMGERLSAANLLIDHISHAKKGTFRTRLKQLDEALTEVALLPASERICTLEEIEKLSLNSLFSFASAGKYRLPFYNISLEDARIEIVDSFPDLSKIVGRSLVPVFYFSVASEKRRQNEIIRLMMNNGYQAAIAKTLGVCRPGDNMFRLMRLPFSETSKSFEQYEMQGLLDAIDEFLLVTLVKDQEL